VSLIFEALKKLDREKKAPERGFLVVGGAPLPGRRLQVPALLLLLAAAGGGGFLIARATRPAPPAGPSAALPATAAPTAAPATVRQLAPPAPLPPESPAPALSGLPRAAEPLTPAAPAPAPEAAAPPRAAPAFALEAVADQDGHPVAIVNGQLVRVGDLVDGARVLRIDPEEVELEKDGRRLVLTF
jgi:hypothetical protein